MLSKDGEILKEQPHQCDDVSFSSYCKTLSLDEADGEIRIKEIESAIGSLKCGKAGIWSYCRDDQM